MEKSKLPAKKKQEIINIARDLINEKGVGNVSIRDIVKSVGMAQGLFYYYFKSKEEVLESIIDEYVDLFCLDIQNSIDNIQNEYDNWKDKIITVIQMLVKLYKENNSPLEQFNNSRNKEIYMNMVYKSIDRLALLIETIIVQAVESGFIKIKYPKETSYVLIYGIIDLINHKEILDENIFINIVFQTLGIN